MQMSGTAVYIIQMNVEILAPQVHLLIEIVEHANASRAKLVSDLVHVVAILSCEGEADIIAVVVTHLSSLSHRTPMDAGSLTLAVTASCPTETFQVQSKPQ